MIRLPLLLVVLVTGATFAQSLEVYQDGTRKGVTRSAVDCQGAVTCTNSGNRLKLSVDAGVAEPQPLAGSGQWGVIADGGSQTLSPAFRFEAWAHFDQGFGMGDGGYSYLYPGPRDITSGADFIPWQPTNPGDICVFCDPPWISPTLGNSTTAWKQAYINYLDTAWWGEPPPALQIAGSVEIGVADGGWLSVAGIDAGRIHAVEELAIPRMAYASFPSAASSIGRLIFDTTFGALWYSDGTFWLRSLPGSPDGGPILITGVVTGSQMDGNLVGGEFINVLGSREYTSGVLRPTTVNGTQLLTTATQGVGIDGGDAWNITGEVTISGGGLTLSGGAAQGASRDGGLSWPVELWALKHDGGYARPFLSEDDHLMVEAHSDAVVNPGNSTTVTLAGGATFTGTAVDLTDYATIRVSLYTSHASATNGFKLQFSNDGTNWDFVRQTSVSAGDTSYPAFNRIARYFRVVYVNGASAQTSFRLQTMLSPLSTEFSRVFADEVPSGNASSIVTSSMIYGLSSAGGGTYVQAKVNPSGALNTDVTGTVTANQGLSRDGGTDWPVLAKQGFGIDGGAAWNITGVVSLASGAVVTSTANQGTSRDGGIGWVIDSAEWDRYETYAVTAGVEVPIDVSDGYPTVSFAYTTAAVGGCEVRGYTDLATSPEYGQVLRLYGTQTGYLGGLASGEWGYSVNATSKETRLIQIPPGTVRAALYCTGGPGTAHVRKSKRQPPYDNSKYTTNSVTSYAGSQYSLIGGIKENESTTFGVRVNADGKLITDTRQGVGIDGGSAWNVTGDVTVRQGVSRDGGVSWPVEQPDRVVDCSFTDDANYCEIDTTGPFRTFSVVTGGGANYGAGSCSAKGYGDSSYFDGTALILHGSKYLYETGTQFSSISSGDDPWAIIEVPPGTKRLRWQCTGYISGTMAVQLRASVRENEYDKPYVWQTNSGRTIAESPKVIVTIGQQQTASSGSVPGQCVSVSTTATVLGSNSGRVAASVCAAASNTKRVFVKLGGTATTSNFPLEGGQCMSPHGPTAVYTGVIDAIAESGTQSVCAWEF